MSADASEVAARLADAPLAGGWSEALASAAGLLEGWAAMVLVFTPEGELISLATHGVTGETLAEIYRRGALRPDVNPRAAALQQASVGVVVTEEDFLPTGGWITHPFYRDVLRPARSAFAAVVKVAHAEGLVVTFSVWRDAAAGPFGRADRARLSCLAQGVRDAVRIELALDETCRRGALDAFEAAGAAAMSLDGEGRLLQATTAGSALLRSGVLIPDGDGRLAPARLSERHAFAAAVAGACGGPFVTPVSGSVLIGGGAKSVAPLRIDVHPPPRATALRSAARALVVAPGAVRPDRGPMLRAIGLSPAEAEIVEAISAGDSLEGLAERRGRSINTLRVQLRSVYRKLGVGRQSELLSLISRL